MGDASNDGTTDGAIAAAAATAAAAEAAHAAAVHAKYQAEASKRLRADGPEQFLPLADSGSSRLQSLAADPWVDHAALDARPAALRDGQHVKVLVLGAGYGGLLAGVLLQEHAGLAASDVRLVDAAGGFGGTWWWNRYPGLHCDGEAYAYMPLLEETAYVPSRKYVPGDELRAHADRIAARWDLADKALFRTIVESARWDDAGSVWRVRMRTDRGGRGEEDENEDEEAASVRLEVTAQYVVLASGVLTRPQVPRIEGLDTFGGALFHAARWDYGATGGSPTDPDLTRLAGKRVGIVGTGATAVQVVPALARCAGDLFVFQRTPSTVLPRGNRPTDPDEWRASIASRPSWQRDRMANFNRFASNDPPAGAPNLVDDEWTRQPAYCALIGTPAGAAPIDPARVPEHVARLHALDEAPAARRRALVDAAVRDRDTAERLKAWYPVWCKRPTFSDEYLQAFNGAHVHLVDTDGKGPDRATEAGLVVAGTEYPLDVLVLGTGYQTPGVGNGSPAARAAITILGRGGRDFDDKWRAQGATTLHGIASNGFPNLFFSGPMQAGVSANQTHQLQATIRQMAAVISRAEEAAGASKRVVVEVRTEAEEAWSMRCLAGAAWFSSVVGCTPGYINNEGKTDADPSNMAEMMKLGRRSPWAAGMADFERVLEEWRADKEAFKRDLEVTTV